MSRESMNNQQMRLVDILNTMYNDNMWLINNFSNTITDLLEINNQINSAIIELLNNRENTEGRLNRERSNTERSNTEGRLNREGRSNTEGRLNTERSNTEGRNSRNNRSTNQNRENNNYGRLLLNNIPYIVNDINHYRIPTQESNYRTEQNNIRNTNLSRIFQNFLEPINIYPTQSQIESATRYVRYSDILNPINRSCPITLEPFSDSDNVLVIRNCGHIFNNESLNNWFRSNCRCPVCRYDIRTYNSTSYFEDSESSILDVSNNVSTIIDVSQNNVERNNEVPTQSTINGDTYFDLFFSDTGLLNDFSSFTNRNEPLILFNLINSLQRRQ
jgi:hypothetical protein